MPSTVSWGVGFNFREVIDFSALQASFLQPLGHCLPTDNQVVMFRRKCKPLCYWEQQESLHLSSLG